MFGLLAGLGLFASTTAWAQDGEITVWSEDAWGAEVSDAPETGGWIAADGGESSGTFIALHQDGSLHAWGGSAADKLTPVPEGNDFVTASVNQNSAMALREDGTIVEWGDAYWMDGRLMTWPASTTAPAGDGYRDVAAAGTFHAALDADGAIHVWGGYITFDPVVDGAAVDGFVDIDAGNGQLIALHEDGWVAGWGYGGAGAPAGDDFVAIAAGLGHSLALREDGTVEAWGNDWYGEVSETPTAGGFVAISGGAGFSIALDGDGRVHAWGEDWFDKLNVPDEAGFASIAASAQNGLAITPILPSELIAMSPSETGLWSPNHELHDVDLGIESLFGDGPQDFSEMDLLLEVESSQPDDARQGDGRTVDDIQIVGADGATLAKSGSQAPTGDGNARASAFIQPGDFLRVRAERQRTVPGPRTYTVRLTAIWTQDPSVTHTVETTLTVPPHQGRGGGGGKR